MFWWDHDDLPVEVKWGSLGEVLSRNMTFKLPISKEKESTSVIISKKLDWLVLRQTECTGLFLGFAEDMTCAVRLTRLMGPTHT